MIRVPYIEGMLTAETRAWALEHGAELTEHEDLDGTGYYKLLCEWWNKPGDLVIVEHDKVPAPGSVQEMLDCEHEWCTCPYEIGGGIIHAWGTGCVKYSHTLRARYPDLMLRAGVPGEHDPEPPGVYWVVDMRLGALLTSYRVLPHGHAQCEHLHTLSAREREWQAR